MTERTAPPAPDRIEVVAPNFKRRLSGVTATIQRLVPEQAKTLGVVAFGPGLGSRVPRIGLGTLLGLRRPPLGRPFRIWHARRNVEMLAGVILRDLLRARFALVFTSASQRRHKRWTRFLIRRMDAVISTSAATATYLERPSTVVMHGIDTERFRPAEPKPAARLVGCFGRIRAQKGTDLFVEAMIRLLPQYPAWSAVVLGRATGEHAEFLTDLQARAAAAGLSQRIRFPGEVGIDAIAAEYRKLGLFVAPQRWEGFGLTPLEAMASGVAVVATRTGAFPELVVDGVTGRLVPPDDLDALTAGIEAFLADPSRADTAGAAGRARALERHSLAGEAEAIRAVYEGLWRGGAAAPAIETARRGAASAPQ